MQAYFERTGYGLKAPAGGLLRMAPVFALFIACFAIMGGQLWPGSSFGVKAFAAIVFGICQVRLAFMYFIIRVRNVPGVCVHHSMHG